jgi:hypothetical protein
MLLSSPWYLRPNSSTKSCVDDVQCVLVLNRFQIVATVFKTGWVATMIAYCSGAHVYVLCTLSHV